MFGKNPKRPPETGNGTTLQIAEIFPTLQGEGPHVGQPSVFVRLGGCNLACDFCDTEFETFEDMALEDVVQTILHHAARIRDLVVITGGEPLRQNIAPLCERLLAEGLCVQIETNGTVWRELPKAVDIVCSPKATDGRYHKLRPDLLERISVLKFIISAEPGEYNDIGDVGQRTRNIPVYVQPMDAYDAKKNEANRQRALELAMKRGYRLSLQTHKMLGIA